MKRSRIIQVMPSIAYGDAVSNHALLIRKIIKEHDFATKIYASDIDPRMLDISTLNRLERDLSSKDILIFHMAIGSDLTYRIASLKIDKKVIIYHNITPPEYFTRYNPKLVKLVSQGREQLKEISSDFQLALGDSEFNRAELEMIGFQNTGVLPLCLHGEKYDGAPDRNVLEKYTDGVSNIIFVGRIAPNKKQEDVIKAFYYYKKYYNKSARLIIVGSWNGMERYYHDLQRYVKLLELEDVIFTGHVSDLELLAYYRIARMFLSMSEHEGFCVPLLECMHFKVPILAYSAAAVPDTLGEAGLIFKEKNYPAIAALMDIVDKHPSMALKLIESQTERLKDFDERSITTKFWQYINSLQGKGDV